MSYMTYTRKAWETAGYAFNGGVYHLNCADSIAGAEEVYPIFPAQLGGFLCESCHEEVA